MDDAAGAFYAIIDNAGIGYGERARLKMRDDPRGWLSRNANEGHDRSSPSSTARRGRPPSRPAQIRG